MPDNLPDYIAINPRLQTEHPILTSKAKELTFPLKEDDVNDIRILEQKFDQEGNCAGLAAPQIGISKSFIIFSCPDNDDELKKRRPDLIQSMPKTLWINPSYSPASDETHEDFEACFSVIDVVAKVNRYKKIHYQAYDIKGKLIKGAAEGFLARIIQHETDHVNGILFFSIANPETIMTKEEYVQKRKQAMTAELIDQSSE